MKKWDVLDSSYVFKNPFGNLRVDKCLLPNGKLIDKYHINEYPDWVNIVAITTDKNMIFVKQYRHGCNDFFLEIPAGGVKDTENIQDAILRELKEETGYVSDNKPVLIGDFYTNPAIATNKVKTFIIQDVHKEFDQLTDGTEEIEIILHPFDDVENLIKKSEINQLFTVTAYYLAKNYIKNKHIK